MAIELGGGQNRINREIKREKFIREVKSMERSSRKTLHKHSHKKSGNNPKRRVNSLPHQSK